MNSQQKKLNEYRILQTLKHTSRSGSKQGFVKCWKGTTNDHFITMCQIVWYLVNKNYKVFTECEFETSGRSDILAIKDGMGYIIEILKSETREMFLSKLDYYPSECEVIPIRVKDFKRDEIEELLGL